MSSRRRREVTKEPDKTLSDARFQTTMFNLVRGVQGDVDACFDDVEKLEAAVSSGGGRGVPQDVADKISKQAELVQAQKIEIELLKQKQGLLWKAVWGVGGAAGIALLKHVLDMALK